LKLIIDTCSWNRIKDLSDSKIFDLRPIIAQFQCGITEEVQKELEYYHLTSFVGEESTEIIPISSRELNIFRTKYPFLTSLDLADQTLIIVGLRDESVIITEDGELFMGCIGMKVNALRLPMLLLMLTRDGIIPKNQCARIIRYWEEQCRYKQKDIKLWKSELQKIS